MVFVTTMRTALLQDSFYHYDGRFSRANQRNRQNARQHTRLFTISSHFSMLPTKSPFSSHHTKLSFCGPGRAGATHQHVGHIHKSQPRSSLALSLTTRPSLGQRQKQRLGGRPGRGRQWRRGRQGLGSQCRPRRHRATDQRLCSETEADQHTGSSGTCPHSRPRRISAKSAPGNTQRHTINIDRRGMKYTRICLQAKHLIQTHPFRF